MPSVALHPDAANASARRDVAEIYQNLGALFYKRALQGPGTGSKKQDLLTAQSWYRKSLDGWRDLREKGELRGIDAHAPDEAAQALVECQNALERLLGARASSPREEARN